VKTRSQCTEYTDQKDLRGKKLSCIEKKTFTLRDIWNKFRGKHFRVFQYPMPKLKKQGEVCISTKV